MKPPPLLDVSVQASVLNLLQQLKDRSRIDLSLHNPRSRRRSASRGPHRRHAGRRDRRTAADPSLVRQPPAPLHAHSARFLTDRLADRTAVIPKPMHINVKGTLLVDEAVERVGRWLEAGGPSVSRRERLAARRLATMVRDRPGTAFAMRFVDRVIRPEDPSVSAGQLASLVAEAELPGFLSRADRLLLRAGAGLGRRVPGVVMPAGSPAHAVAGGTSCRRRRSPASGCPFAVAFGGGFLAQCEHVG